MFLTHIDEEGNDSPAILIENATAANRAVNLPEFVNVAPNNLVKIDVPAADFYRLFDRAWMLAEKGQYDASISAWEEALKISPDDAKAHNNLGRVLASKGKLEEATTHWQRALEVKPDYAEAHNNLGVAFATKARYEEATGHFLKALQIYPDRAEIHNNLASALNAQGRFDQAVKHWNAALKIDPRYAEARNDMGTGLFLKGKLDEAIGQWQRAVDAKPDFIQARYNLGRALARKGELNGAIRHWRKAVEIDPQFAQAYFGLGDIFYLRGQAPEAMANWTEGLRLKPDYLPALRQKAWVLATWPEASLRRGDEALILAQRSARLSGEGEPETLDILAAANAELGCFDKAAEIARRALAIAAQQNKPVLAEALKTRISHYEAKTPFRSRGVRLPGACAVCPPQSSSGPE
jgi:tetratricopeptide (TPR) repeat protein